MSNVTSSGIPVASLFVVGAFVLLGIAVHLVHLGWIGIPAAIGYNVWAWDRSELFPISGESATTSRKAGWIVNILSALGIFGS